MFKNYLKIALRNIMKHKGYAAINLFGLVVGLASFIVIVLYVHDELSYDKFHTDADRIYRIVHDESGQVTSNLRRITTPGALKETMINEIPEIEQATGIYLSYWGKAVLSNEKYSYYGKNFLFVDNAFFDVFSFKFIHGNPKYVLDDPSSIVLTESLAKRFFGNEDALGQTLQFNQQPPLKVTGIIKDVPAQSHLQFDFLIPRVLANRPNWENSWGEGHMMTYIKVKPTAELPEVETKIQHLIDTHNQVYMKSRDIKETYLAQTLTSIHLNYRDRSSLYLQVLSLVALFILIIAGVNYINLATARSTLRAREIGVRKVMGAHRKALIPQFLAESVLYAAIAGIMAVCLAEIVLPLFNNVMQKNLSLLTSESGTILGFILGFVLLFGFTAGLYPAFYLSSFKPVSIFKKQRISKRKAFDLRKVLVVTQFGLSAFLIVGMIVVQQQVSYIQSADLGFDKDQVVVIDNFRRIANRDRNFVVRRALEAIPGVEKVGAFNEIVGLQNHNSGSPMHLKGSNNQQEVLWTNVGYHYLDAVGIKLIEGRNFSPEFENASSRNVVILNETAVRLLNIPEPVIGQKIVSSGWPPRTIIGVVKDFHFTPLYHEIKPFAFGWTSSGNTAALKLSGGNIRETLSRIKQVWKQFVPNVPPDFYFFDEALNQQYRSEQNFQTLFSAMTIFALVIACLGLFGLVAFTAEQRTKEIGIRKVLGASVSKIVAMLSIDFVKLVIFANIIAWPIAWFAMNRWLANFAYHIEINWWIFALAGSVAMGIALFTVCWQSIRAAIANPVESLRYE